MPNGVSCAYFAVKNFKTGKQNHDIFRDGIGSIQTTRTVDTIVQQTSKAASPFAKFIGKAASIAKKVVYPLIILSGIRTTAKSDDKVKTGAEQAGAISVMYGFEQIAEKALNKADNWFKTTSVSKNKFAKAGFYILKGAAFIAASLAGYDAGKIAAGCAIDKIRGKNKQTAEEQIKPDENALASVYDDIIKFTYN